MTKFDLLSKNGRLVDPAGDRIGRFEVALAGGRVAEVEADLNPENSLFYTAPE